MSNDLRSGSRIIRIFQVSALLIAVAGVILSMTVLATPTLESIDSYLPWILSAFIVDSLLIAVVFLMQAARGLVKRINHLGMAFNRGAEGDLTVRVDLGDKDELSMLGQNFNGMLEKLAGMVTGITSAIHELRRIASRNDEASGRVLAAAKIQTEGLAETSTAIEAINRSAAEVGRGVETLARSSSGNRAAIDEMTGSIVEVRRNVEAQAGAIDDVSSSIIEIVAVVEETNRNVAGLKESAVATSSSVAEMDVSLQHVEKSTRGTVAAAVEVQEDARHGQEAVEATIRGIGEIRTSSGNTFTSITRLSERVAAIGKIVSVIDELTEQTNLLALNSAIIAAQAGEHGKGFAIVSGEIKELANRTKRSTTEIEGLIQGMREETAQAVAAIRITEDRVADGEQLSRRSGDALNRIVTGVQLVTDQINEIARATAVQSSGSRKIHGAMGNVSDRVGQIALSCQEQAATSRSIMSAAELMKELTSRVLASTSRQENVGEGIAESTAQMSDVVEMIRKASLDQADCCRRITDSVRRVSGSAESSLDSAQSMEDAVESLTTQIELLQQEIAKLKTA
jgi:methyl-accepting chemotaxis protein